ncbi:hypothetical protein [Myroides odoratus]|uniref:Uncharacterized protein n=1 Tax=Myroides odoratus TaxID=256 RepID=A0A9Q6ZBF1_MYROD|nr:hypothetical protein [Myroides odoratus]EHQ42002.1 hypothetical protein Myrod_1169 [Myroides odoratus DSM 2801]EKB03039.1 hypothetical protein HMPREF9716_03591 [Myroides odoratus CIP 103059]QQT99390.1 hypothetical protein I6I88_14525 [Myroides odoratus]WQD58407.1 hypothetical protein U0010_04435 [Myroides odoratus]STZ29265.1 Uncharacterised protein [Myroides odoratus]
MATDRNVQVYFSFLDKEMKYEVLNQMVQGNKRQAIRYTTTIKKVEGWFDTHYVITRTPQVLSPIVDNPYMEAIMLTSSLWDELKLSINRDGEIKKIVNLQAIQDYWTTVLKFKLLQMYTGTCILGLVAQLEQVLMNEELFRAKINQDSFFYYWIKYNIGEYIKNYNTGKYTKVGKANQQYQIEQTEKGRTIQGKGKKTAAELDEIKRKWKLNIEEELDYEEQCDSVYDCNQALVQLVQKERYTQGSSVLYESTITIIKV